MGTDKKIRQHAGANSTCTAILRKGFACQKQRHSRCRHDYEVANVIVVPTPRMALFLAGKAFTQYRRAGGIRSGVLPDFFIGAHAAVEQLPLLTRDSRRYRHYFPTVVLITPESER